MVVIGGGFGGLQAAKHLATAPVDLTIVDRRNRRRALLTFVIVCAGPTGVDMAGQIAERARNTLRSEFRSIDSAQSQVLLIETADPVLTTFPAAARQPSDNPNPAKAQVR